MLIRTSPHAALEVASKPFSAAINPHDSAQDYSVLLFASKGGKAPAVPDENVLVVTGAGEYEKQDVFIFAFSAFADHDELAFQFEQDNRSVLVLPAVSPNVSAALADQASGIDVLVLPVNAKTDPKELKTLIERVDPRVAVLLGGDAELAKKAGLPTEEQPVSEFDTDKGTYQEEKTNVILLA